MGTGSRTSQHIVIQLAGLPSHNRGTSNGRRHIGHGAGHADDIAHRHQWHQQLHRQANGGKHRSSGDDGGSRHACRTDRSKQSDHGKRHILPWSVIESKSVDGEHGGQHRPHAGTSRHTNGGANGRGEVRDVSPYTDGADLANAQRQRGNTGLCSECSGLRRQYGFEERQRRYLGHQFHQRAIHQERLNKVQCKAQQQYAEQRKQRIGFGGGCSSGGSAKHHHRVRRQFHYVTDCFVNHVLGLLEEPRDNIHALLLADRHNRNCQYRCSDDNRHHAVTGQVADDVLREEVEHHLIERRSLRGQEAGRGLVIDQRNAGTDVQRDRH